MKEVLFPMKTFYPYLWLDMAIKAISLFIMIWLISRVIDKYIRFDNQYVHDRERNFKNVYIICLEVIVQIATMTVVLYIFKNFFRYICDNFDFLSLEESEISWQSASLFIPFALFNMSTNLIDKLNWLGNKYIQWR
jgi:hypothetical protein